METDALKSSMLLDKKEICGIGIKCSLQTLWLTLSYPFTVDIYGAAQEFCDASIIARSADMYGFTVG